MLAGGSRQNLKFAEAWHYQKGQKEMSLIRKGGDNVLRKLLVWFTLSFICKSQMFEVKAHKLCRSYCLTTTGNSM